MIHLELAGIPPHQLAAFQDVLFSEWFNAFFLTKCSWNPRLAENNTLMHAESCAIIIMHTR
jgi:hypothetical protein